MKRVIVLCIVFSFCFLSSCFALEWKKMHEQADKASLQEVLDFEKKDPGSADGLYRLGLVYLNLHKDKDAENVFGRMLSIDPGSPEAKWGLAEVLRRQHELSESEKLLKEVIKLQPNFPPALVTLAYIKYTKLELNEAVRLASKVINLGLDNVDLSNFVRAYLIYGGTKGLIAHWGGPLSKVFNGTVVLSYLRKAESLQPDSAGVLLGMGSFYLLAPTIAGGDLEKAQVYLNKAIAADPLLADAYARRAQLYRFKGDNKKYEEYLNKAQEIDPGSELAIDIKSGECKFVCAR